MSFVLFRLLRPAVLSVISVATLYGHPGHPGHDGDELVWEMSHLAAYPVASVVCFTVLGVGAVAAWQLGRRRQRSVQSLRGSQVSRGN
jgi:hypothetical protein